MSFLPSRSQASAASAQRYVRRCGQTCGWDVGGCYHASRRRRDACQSTPSARACAHALCHVVDPDSYAAFLRAELLHEAPDRSLQANQTSLLRSDKLDVLVGLIAVHARGSCHVTCCALCIQRPRRSALPNVKFGPAEITYIRRGSTRRELFRNVCTT